MGAGAHADSASRRTFARQAASASAFRTAASGCVVPTDVAPNAPFVRMTIIVLKECVSSTTALRIARTGLVGQMVAEENAASVQGEPYAHRRANVSACQTVGRRSADLTAVAEYAGAARRNPHAKAVPVSQTPARLNVLARPVVAMDATERAEHVRKVTYAPTVNASAFPIARTNCAAMTGAVTLVALASRDGCAKALCATASPTVTARAAAMTDVEDSADSAGRLSSVLAASASAPQM